jgi:hypothetical protein
MFWALIIDPLSVYNLETLKVWYHSFSDKSSGGKVDLVVGSLSFSPSTRTPKRYSGKKAINDCRKIIICFIIIIFV